MSSDPKRLTVVGATELERTLLQAARGERPSPELTARMAAGLGISVGAAVTAAAAPAAAAPIAAANTTMGAWVAAGVIVAAVTAGVVGVRLSPGSEKPAVKTVQAVAPSPTLAPAISAPSRVANVSEARGDKSRRRSVAAAAPAPAAVAANDLRDQIALMDAARTAVKAGSADQALALLRRYDTSYPAGAFRPEALALRIEALSEDGRRAEAQALARDFLARYPRSPVAERVARVAAR